MASGPPSHPGMAWVPGGEVLMGSDRFYPEEGPARPVRVDGLWVDESPVTVAEFARFVEATGHVTEAEVAPDPADYPGADPDLLVPGSLVFRASEGPVDLRDVRNWWEWVPGATWRTPEGPGSSVEDMWQCYEMITPAIVCRSSHHPRATQEHHGNRTTGPCRSNPDDRIAPYPALFTGLGLGS